MKFRSKPVEIEATQWFPGVDIPCVRAEECWAAIGIRTPGVDPQRFRQPDKHYVMTTHGQKAYLEPGDWVIAEPDKNGHYPCKPKIFAERYEPAP